MDYSISADLLAKFNSASPPIQALWLVLATVVAIAAIASPIIILHLWLKHRSRPLPAPEPKEEQLVGEIFYGVVRASDGRWLLYVDGTIKEIEEDARAWIEAQRREEERDDGGAMH